MSGLIIFLKNVKFQRRGCLTLVSSEGPHPVAPFCNSQYSIPRTESVPGGRGCMAPASCVASATVRHAKHVTTRDFALPAP